MTKNAETAHDRRMKRAHVALEGLSIGDAFGERFFLRAPWPRIENRVLPDPPWRHTDDTAMACAIVEVLAHAERIDQDMLAQSFAERFSRDPDRGYGGGAFKLLHSIARGEPWREASAALFGGGSFGNGGAMRAAPIGAYFADDIDRVVAEARASAEVTHAHLEGQAGAIAVAVAAAYAENHRADPTAAREGLIPFVLAHTPSGETRDGIVKASEIPLTATLHRAASELGTGEAVTAMDTVPFCTWCAARHLDDFEEAMWTTVAGLGDRDTTCAIVGGIVAASTKRPIPDVWRRSRERLYLAMDALP
jgi:ADP-ribosylglycohydrolase